MPEVSRITKVLAIGPHKLTVILTFTDVGEPRILLNEVIQAFIEKLWLPRTLEPFRIFNSTQTFIVLPLVSNLVDKDRTYFLFIKQLQVDTSTKAIQVTSENPDVNNSFLSPPSQVSHSEEFHSPPQVFASSQQSKISRTTEPLNSDTGDLQSQQPVSQNSDDFDLTITSSLENRLDNDFWTGKLNFSESLVNTPFMSSYLEEFNQNRLQESKKLKVNNILTKRVNKNISNFSVHNKFIQSTVDQFVEGEVSNGVGSPIREESASAQSLENNFNSQASSPTGVETDTLDSCPQTQLDCSILEPTLIVISGSDNDTADSDVQITGVFPSEPPGGASNPENLNNPESAGENLNDHGPNNLNRIQNNSQFPESQVASNSPDLNNSDADTQCESGASQEYHDSFVSPPSQVSESADFHSPPQSPTTEQLFASSQQFKTSLYNATVLDSLPDL